MIFSNGEKNVKIEPSILFTLMFFFYKSGGRTLLKRFNIVVCPILDSNPLPWLSWKRFLISHLSGLLFFSYTMWKNLIDINLLRIKKYYIVYSFFTFPFNQMNLKKITCHFSFHTHTIFLSF